MTVLFIPFARRYETRHLSDTAARSSRGAAACRGSATAVEERVDRVSHR